LPGTIYSVAEECEKAGGRSQSVSTAQGNEHVCNEPSKYNRRKCDQGEVDYLLWRFSGQIARRNIVQLDAKSQSFATGQPPKTIAEVRLRIDDHNA